MAEPQVANGLSPCRIRPATELADAQAVWWPLMQSLGWNRGFEDSITHYTSAGASAWLHVLPLSSTAAQGCIIPFVYDNSTGWVGFFCVNAEFRGKGYGRPLFQACMDYFAARSVRFVGLDAVTEQKATYERRGFVDKGTVRLMMRRSVQELPVHVDSTTLGDPSGKVNYDVVDIKKIPGEELLRSELACTGMERSRLWTTGALLGRSDLFGYAATSKQQHDSLQGWIVVRSCPSGYRFGPLYANSVSIASELMGKALAKCTGDGEMIAEIWVGNAESEAVFERYGWTPAGTDYHRMWLDGWVPAEQSAGGRAEKSMFAIFDAGEG